MFSILPNSLVHSIYDSSWEMPLIVSIFQKPMCGWLVFLSINCSNTCTFRFQFPLTKKKQSFPSSSSWIFFVTFFIALCRLLSLKWVGELKCSDGLSKNVNKFNVASANIYSAYTLLWMSAKMRNEIFK